MARTWPALAHAMAQSLCCTPFAPFTIQHAGSTTSPTIVRGPTFAGSASFAAAVAAGVAGFATAAAGLGVAVGVPCANAAGAMERTNEARSMAAKALRVFIRDLHPRAELG